MLHAPNRCLSLLSATRRLPYQHGFHAGNAADVLKHCVLICMLQHMKQKDKPFVYCDTHAGAGAYDLRGDEGSTLREYDTGIGELRRAALHMPRPVPEALETLLALADEKSYTYPGSPLIAQALCRPSDELVLVERAEDQYERLVRAVGNDGRVTSLNGDGYKALRDRQACPQAGKRRALVLIDPPYQYGSDTEQIARLVQHMAKHWRSARVAIWYPITRDLAKVERLYDQVRAAASTQALDCLAVEMRDAGRKGSADGAEASEGAGGSGMLGSGMLLVQPPYGIDAQLKEELLPPLASALGQEVRVFMLQ